MITNDINQQVAIVRTLYTLATRTLDLRNDYDLVLMDYELDDYETRIGWNIAINHILSEFDFKITNNPGAPMDANVSKYNEGQLQAISLYLMPILDDLLRESLQPGFNMIEFI